MTALIGPSGCGKSTFLRTINRMNDLIDGTRLTGTMTLDGRDIYDKSVDVVHLRKRVGMVFQKPNPFPMSIYDNICYGPRIHGARGRNELDELVEFRLSRASRSATRFSKDAMTARMAAWASGDTAFQSESGIEG